MNTKPVNIIQLALDSGQQVDDLMKLLHGDRTPYFLDKPLLLKHLRNGPRQDVIKYAGNFHSMPVLVKFPCEVEMHEAIVACWAARFTIDLEQESFAETVKDMISESLGQPVQHLAAVKKWIEIKRPMFASAQTLEELRKLFYLPCGVEDQHDPVIEAAFERWSELSRKKFAQVHAPDELSALLRLAPPNMWERIQRKLSDVVCARIRECTSFRELEKLKQFAHESWDRQMFDSRRFSIAHARLEAARTQSAVRKMMESPTYYSLIRDAMIRKLAVLQA